MITEILNHTEFLEIIDSDKKNIISFHQPDCGFCRWHLKRLREKFSDLDLYTLDVSKDYDWYSHNAKLKPFFPFTRVYLNKKIIYHIDGELFQTQIKKLIEVSK
jgi:hypothetical protein